MDSGSQPEDTVYVLYEMCKSKKVRKGLHLSSPQQARDCGRWSVPPNQWVDCFHNHFRSRRPFRIFFLKVLVNSISNSKSMLFQLRVFIHACIWNYSKNYKKCVQGTSNCENIPIFLQSGLLIMIKILSGYCIRTKVIIRLQRDYNLKSSSINSIEHNFVRL